MNAHLKTKQAKVRRRRRVVIREEQPLEASVGYAHPTAVRAAPAPRAWRAEELMRLQRGAGNCAVGRLLGRAGAALPLVMMAPSRGREQAVLTWPLRRAQRGVLQRIDIPRVETADPDWKKVPDEHLARVRAAVGIVHQKVQSKRLITYFRDNAPGGTLNTLKEVSDRAQVWELRREGSQGMATVGGSDMAYDTFIYRIGRWQIAATLLHEMGHLASFPTEEQCEQAIDAGRVYAPFIRSVRPRQAAPGEEVTISGLSFGPRQESTDRITFGGADAGRAATWEWQHDGGGTIRVRVPTNAESGPVVVENNRIPSNQVPFRVTPSAP